MGCDASQPSVCQGFNNRWTSSGFSLQGVVGADVTLTSRFIAFGQFKLTGPVQDFGSSHTSLTAGVRIGIW
jgi:hypothetical protein